MKKFTAVLLVVLTICAAGTAFAQQQGRNDRQQPKREAPQMQPRQPGNFDYPPCFCGRYDRNDFCRNYWPQQQPRPVQPQQQPRQPGQPGQPAEFQGRNDGKMRFTPDMPKEIREKAAELAKLRIDLEEAMTAEPVNKAKAIEVHEKMQKLENEIDAWRFSQRLERIEATKKQHELNRNFKPVPPAAPKTDEAPKPEPAE